MSNEARLREALEKVWEEWPDIRQLIEGWATTTPANEWSEWDEATRQATIRLTTVIDAALSAPPEQPTRNKFTHHCSICGKHCTPLDFNGFRVFCSEHGHVDAEEVMPTDKRATGHIPQAESVTPPGVEAGSGRTDDYVAWLRWVGDEEHRHLVVCDSDSPGAFKVYRRPND